MFNSWDYSKMDTYIKCPYKFYLQYILKTPRHFAVSPDNPLTIGSALHLGIEKGFEACKDYYYKANNSIWDKQCELELKKLEFYVPVLHDTFKDGYHEITLNSHCGNIPLYGRLDYLSTDNKIIYDWKYTKSGIFYKNSMQLQLYAYMLDVNTGEPPEELAYIIIPKCTLKQRNYESYEEYTQRCLDWLQDRGNISSVNHSYNRGKVEDWITSTINQIMEDKTYQCKTSPLCPYCDFKDKCPGFLKLQAEKQDIEGLVKI